MFELMKKIMTLGDTLAGYKTHATTAATALTAVLALLTVVIIPFMSGDISSIALITQGWPYVTAIFASFGASAIKAGMDRSN